MVAKILPVFHMDMISYYIDIDRGISLILLVTIYYLWKREEFSINSIVVLLFGFALSLMGAFFLGLSVEKVALLFVMTALVEEILFRGVLYELLLKKIKPVIVLVLTSLVFTLLHPPIYEDFLYGAAVFLTGVIAGTFYLLGRKTNPLLGVVYATVFHSFIILAGLKLSVI